VKISQICTVFFCHPHSTIPWLSKEPHKKITYYTLLATWIFCHPYSTIAWLSKTTTNLHGIFCHRYSTIPWLSRESHIFTTTAKAGCFVGMKKKNCAVIITTLISALVSPTIPYY
jgi:hypothetical protein